MLARYTKGIKDCDVGSPSLCVHGADFVREHEGLILRTYDAYANQTAKVLGRSAPVVWLMEPDWHQYNEATQRGGGLTLSILPRPTPCGCSVGPVNSPCPHVPSKAADEAAPTTLTR